MKNILPYVVLFYVSVFFAQNNNNQTPYYYYYQGQKIYLNLNTQRFYLDASSDFNESILNNQGLQPFSIKNETNPVNGEIKKWGKIELENQLTETEYFQKLSNLEQLSTSIETVQPSFTTMNGDVLEKSSYFYVKLNQASDITLLQQEANNKF